MPHAVVSFVSFVLLTSSLAAADGRFLDLLRKESAVLPDECRAPVAREEVRDALPGRDVDLSNGLRVSLPGEWAVELVSQDVENSLSKWTISLPAGRATLVINAKLRSDEARSHEEVVEIVGRHQANPEQFLKAFASDLSFFDYVNSLTVESVLSAPEKDREMLAEMLYRLRTTSPKVMYHRRLAGPRATVYLNQVIQRDKHAVVLFRLFDQEGKSVLGGSLLTDGEKPGAILETLIKQIVATAKAGGGDR